MATTNVRIVQLVTGASTSNPRGHYEQLPEFGPLNLQPRKGKAWRPSAVHGGSGRPITATTG